MLRIVILVFGLVWSASVFAILPIKAAEWRAATDTALQIAHTQGWLRGTVTLKPAAPEELAAEYGFIGAFDRGNNHCVIYYDQRRAAHPYFFDIIFAPLQQEDRHSFLVGILLHELSHCAEMHVARHGAPNVTHGMAFAHGFVPDDADDGFVLWNEAQADLVTALYYQQVGKPHLIEHLGEVRASYPGATHQTRPWLENLPATRSQDYFRDAVRLLRVLATQH
jgi:hypothetical protein